jgi:hypothetical protein
MADAADAPDVLSGEGGHLAPEGSGLRIDQRIGVLQTKQQQPTITARECAALYGLSAKSVERVWASATVDLQPVLRSMAGDMVGVYEQAVREGALKGRHEGVRDFLIDGGALPDRAKAGTGLSVTVVVSAPPGTPQFVAIQAPAPLVLEAQAGPQAPLTPLLPPGTHGDA